MNELTSKIKQWAEDRNLHTADPKTQLLKCFEELAETSTAILKNKPKSEIMDGIGDTYVTLVILATQLGIDIEKCVEQAYNEIKDRKGKLINGTFIKESDLL